VPHIVTGDMIREMKERPTELGAELRAIYDRGDLVGDEMMIRLIRDRLDRGDTLPGFVLDGFPRTMVQAEALDDLLRELGRSIDVVFDFLVPDRQQLVDRLLKRALDENRSDDTPEAMQRRHDLYDKETAPLGEYYRSTRGNVVGIHADRTIEAVFHEIQQALSAVEARA
jgi:adenylate kinase